MCMSALSMMFLSSDHHSADMSCLPGSSTAYTELTTASSDTATSTTSSSVTSTMVSVTTITATAAPSTSEYV